MTLLHSLLFTIKSPPPSCPVFSSPLLFRMPTGNKRTRTYSAPPVQDSETRKTLLWLIGILNSIGNSHTTEAISKALTDSNFGTLQLSNLLSDCEAIKTELNECKDPTPVINHTEVFKRVEKYPDLNIPHYQDAKYVMENLNHNNDVLYLEETENALKKEILSHERILSFYNDIKSHVSCRLVSLKKTNQLKNIMIVQKAIMKLYDEKLTNNVILNDNDNDL
jgi:hypothetical protein